VIRHSLRHGLAPGVVLMASLLALAGPVLAAGTAGHLATITVSSAGIDFRPEVEYDRAILTVAGGDAVRRFEFAPGESPFLDVFAGGGDALADGTYGWELDLLPTQDQRRELMIAASKNGGVAPGARQAQNGSFTVVGGYIVDPELQEAQATGRGGSAPAGLGAETSESMVRGQRAASDVSRVLDGDSGVCADVTGMTSSRCEAETLSVLESLKKATVDPFGSMQQPRTGSGDSDSAMGAASGRTSDPIADMTEATPPQRTYDPEGANGRPRSEEDPR
jgi:hypothetical protein